MQKALVLLLILLISCTKVQINENGMKETAKQPVQINANQTTEQMPETTPNTSKTTYETPNTVKSKVLNEAEADDFGDVV